MLRSLRPEARFRAEVLALLQSPADTPVEGPRHAPRGDAPAPGEKRHELRDVQAPVPVEDGPLRQARDGLNSDVHAAVVDEEVPRRVRQRRRARRGRLARVQQVLTSVHREQATVKPDTSLSKGG